MTISKIKEARLNAGLTQLEMSTLTDIPVRTIQDWENGQRTPSKWVTNLVVKELNHIHDVPFQNNSHAVQSYAEICIKFANDTAEWGDLNSRYFYTTHYSSWAETSDNAHGGIPVDWAFHLTKDEIEAHAGEMLFECLINELNCCVENEDVETENIESIINNYTII